MIIYMNVPYAEKDQAKALGARWNPIKKQWFIESPESLQPFLRWLPRHLMKPNTERPQKPQKPRRRHDRRTYHGTTVGVHFTEAYAGDAPPWE
jgi:hypothetical protein